MAKHGGTYPNPFKIFLFIDDAPGHSIALTGMNKEMNAVLMAANTTFILQPPNQGVILTFKSYYLRNRFCKTIAATDSDSLMDLDKVK